MEFKNKRRMSFFVIVVFSFFDGIEYALVFPTLWEYLQHLGTPSTDVYYLGLCISAVPFTDMFLGLFVGRLLDKTLRVGMILLFLNVFLIISSLMYLYAQSPVWILASRLVAGIGEVASVSLITDISRSTSSEERTGVIIGFNIAEQIGLLFGPSCNLFLRKMNFQIGSLKVNKLNAPGLFMAVVYILFELLVLFCYFDLAKEKKKEDERLRQEEQHQEQLARLRQEEQHQIQHQWLRQDEQLQIQHERLRQEEQRLIHHGRLRQEEQHQEQNDCVTQEKQHQEQHEWLRQEGQHQEQHERLRQEGQHQEQHDCLRQKEQLQIQHEQLRQEGQRQEQHERLRQEDQHQELHQNQLEVEQREEIAIAPPTWSEYRKEIFTPEFIAVIFLRFIALFNQTCLETIVTPMMKTYFNYGDYENSFMYLFGGIELVFVSLIITVMSKRIADRSFILVGIVLHFAALIWFLAFVPRYQPDDRSNLASFGAGAMLDLASVSIICDIGVSLSTKLVKSEVQGVATGVRRFLMNYALLVGPLWGGSTIKRLYLLFGVPLGMLGIATILYFDSFSRIGPRPNIQERVEHEVDEGLTNVETRRSDYPVRDIETRRAEECDSEQVVRSRSGLIANENTPLLA